MVGELRIATYDWHAAKGAVFQDFFGCEIPSHYGNYQKEYSNLRNAAVIRDVSHFGKVRITGRDRQRFINSMITNDLKDRKPGEGVAAAFLDVKGHLHGDMKFYVFADHLLMALQHYMREKVMQGLDRYVISEDVQMKDVTADYGMVQVLGPQAQLFLESNLNGPLPEKSFSFSTLQFADAEVHVIRLASGFVMLSPAVSTTALLSALDLPLIGMKAFEIYRVESGLPLMHIDMDEGNFPQEAGLGPLLNFHKGCYLGQEVMARIDAQGHVNRHLMGVAASAPIERGDGVYKGNREVGRITSSVHSLLLNQPFGIGYLRREFAQEGEQVEVGDHHITALVRKLPLPAGETS